MLLLYHLVLLLVLASKPVSASVFAPAVDKEAASADDSEAAAAADAEEAAKTVLERMEKMAGQRILESNPDPYKHHHVRACYRDVDCYALNGGCSHEQYIGDVEAKLSTDHSPKCYQPRGPLTRGVCLCPECTNQLHCYRATRCPYSLSGSCVTDHAVRVCKCGKAKRDAISRGRVGQENWDSLWEFIVCHNIFLRRMLADSITCPR